MCGPSCNTHKLGIWEMQTLFSATNEILQLRNIRWISFLVYGQRSIFKFFSCLAHLITKFVDNIIHFRALSHLRGYYAQKQFYYRDTIQQQRLMTAFPQLPFSERFSRCSSFSGIPTTNFSSYLIISSCFIKIFLLAMEVGVLQ